MYKPKYILLAVDTPVNQYLCDYCENCDLILHALTAEGLKGLQLNKCGCLDASFCNICQGQFGTNYSFAKKECIRC